MLHKKLNKRETISAWSMIIICAIFYCYEYFLRISPGVMANELMQFFNVDAKGIGRIHQAYFWAYTPMQLIVGILVDRYRPKFLLPIAVLSCALGGYLTGATHWLLVAEMGRFLQGFGSSFAFVGAMKIAAVWLPKNRFSFVAGCVTTLGFIGAMFGQIMMARLVVAFSWQHTLMGIALSGLVLAAVVFFFVRLPDDVAQSYRQRRIDLANIKLNIRKVVLQPKLWLAGIIGTCLWLPNSVFVSLWGLPYYSVMYNISTVQATELLSLVFLGWAIGGPLQGLIADRFGNIYKQMAIGSILSIILLCIAIYVPMSLNQLRVCLVAMGLFSSVQVMIFTVARMNVQERFLGMGIAFINCLTMLGGTFIPGVIGKLLDAQWDHKFYHGVPVFSISNYQHAFLLIPVIVSGAILAALILGILEKKDARALVNKNIINKNTKKAVIAIDITE